MAANAAAAAAESSSAPAVAAAEPKPGEEAPLEDATPKTVEAAIDRRDSAAAIALVKRLQVKDLNILSLPKARGMTLLHVAALHLEDVALAIVARPDFTALNAKSRTGRTALHHAAGAGFVSVCSAIMSHGAFTEAHATDAGGMTACDMARECGQQAIVELLKGAKEDDAAAKELADAIIYKRNHAKALELLKKPSVPGLNRIHDKNATLLHHAVDFISPPDVALAILARPEFQHVNAATEAGCTALHLAAGAGTKMLPVAKALVAHPQFTALFARDSPDQDGRTALDIATSWEKHEMAQFLREAEAAARARQA